MAKASEKQTASKPRKSNLGKWLETGGPGRKKGVPNKINQDIVSMILSALEAKGGLDYLLSIDDKLLISLVRRVVPRDVRMSVSGQVEVLQALRSKAGIE